ncbi:DSBA oxidoreductase [Rhizobium sp. PDO1-076]|uniref:DsbA family protein n=1 Tax=Rhizobium sp. PDO1-076 TaxID=1125979 RepID=UPI00024E2EA5|nr:DsbA family protein [Rhizobium sp. PDO1-076]EHS52853.1 DSBA oxidoreductase [Rhizobium sp. PDO1-076]
MALNFKTIAATALVLLPAMLPMPASALDETQKKEIGEFVREYLIENPEIMLDVQDALQKKQEEARLKKASSAVADHKDALFSSEHDIAIGNPKGDVTLVEFFDYNCGYCRRAHDDMSALLEKDKNIRFVLKEFPILGPESVAAHKVSDAVRKLSPEKYPDFFHAMMTSDGRASEESAIAIAVGLGLTEEALRAKMKDSPNDASVQEAYQLATSLGITGTPSYILGNEAVFGAVGSEALEAKVANMRSCGKATC